MDHGAIPLIDELSLIGALSVAVALLLARLRLPTVAGLLLAGAIAGPFGFQLVKSTHAIQILAEVGVVLLLFSIGLEFSLERLRLIFRTALVGGLLQVGMTTAATIIAAKAFGLTLREGLFLGFVFAMSSTAIVLRALAERRELDAPHGRFIVGTLIFQDLCVVPMVLIVPLLSASSALSDAVGDVAFALGKAALLVAATLAVARLIVPRVLLLVDASRSREVFLLAVLAICTGTAWLTSMAGLSLALGAFLGGMVVAGTEFGHRALGDVLPIRDVFVSLFFVSLGMLFDIRVVFDAPIVVALMLGGFLMAKGMLATLSAMAMRFPARVAWLAGVGLAQFGEFGFVLVQLGETSGVADPTLSKPLLAAGIISMFLTPVLVRLGPHITAGERILAPLEKLIGVKSIDDADVGVPEFRDHVVIVGFGVAGQMLARALARDGIRYVVIELNAQTVKKFREENIPVYYGDATSEEALHHAHIEKAKALVLLMSDPQATQRVIAGVKKLAPQVKIFTRSRYLAESPLLVSLGASEVIVEEVQGALQMIQRVEEIAKPKIPA